MSHTAMNDRCKGTCKQLEITMARRQTCNLLLTRPTPWPQRNAKLTNKNNTEFEFRRIRAKNATQHTLGSVALLSSSPVTDGHQNYCCRWLLGVQMAWTFHLPWLTAELQYHLWTLFCIYFWIIGRVHCCQSLLCPPCGPCHLPNVVHGRQPQSPLLQKM